MQPISRQYRIISSVIAVFYMMTLFPYSAYALEEEGAKRNRALVEAAFTGEKASAVISAERGGEVRLGRATIVIPPGALKKDTEISITRLFRVADTGERLYNATEGRGGYRFLPAGQQFEKEVIIRLPYGEELSGKKAALDELKTYFYDTKKGVWTALTRRVLLEDEGLIESESTHFTDMINGTLVLPETAEALDFNINSIKNLEAANPLSGIIQMKSPEADSFGDASFSFTLEVPQGRRGMAPELLLAYSSGSGNGIMGKGFDIRYGSVITTDTRQGLPKYDGNDTYVKDGTILEKVGGRGADRGRGDIRYRPEREAAFERIIRHHEKNGNTADDWWEVTDRQGRVRRYGRYGDGGVDGKVACVTEATRGIFTWYLTEEEDSYGNTVRYVYKKHGNYVYPDEIRYTGYYKGSHYTEGKHIVKFGYHETENTLRPDVRTDGRGKFITECALRLAWIQTYYGAITEGSLIRSYQFTYETGLGGVSLVSAFRVAYRNGESYEYRFTYEDLPKGEGNTYTGEGMFAEPIQWGTGKLQSGKTENTGRSISGSAGGGYGTRSFDVRTTGGVTGSRSYGGGYMTDTLVDINGDGKPDRVRWEDERLHVFLRNDAKYEAAFDNRFDEYIVSEVSEGDNIQKIEAERTSSSSIGWNIYTGSGSKGISAGVTYSEVYQKSTSTTESSFMDVDGDGRVDIVCKDETKGGLYYLRNTGRFDSNRILFERKTFAGVPLADVTKRLEQHDIEKYAATYYKQTPFRAWHAPYPGTIKLESSIRTGEDFNPIQGSGEASGVYADIYVGDGEYGNAGTFFRHRVKKGETATADTANVAGGQYVYFINDTTLDPQHTDMEWNVKIRYSKIQPFSTKDTPLLLVPEATLHITIAGSAETVSDEIKDSYRGDVAAYIRARKLLSEEKAALYTFGMPGKVGGECIITGILKEDWHTGAKRINRLSVAETRAYIEAGRYIPGVLTKAQFTALKTYVREKYKAEADDKKKARWESFATWFSYDADSERYRLYVPESRYAPPQEEEEKKQEKAEIFRFYYDYFSEDPGDALHTIQKIKKAALENYVRNDITPQWKGEQAIYTIEKAHSTLNGDRIGGDGTYLPGATYKKDGKEWVYIGGIDGEAIDACISDGRLYRREKAVGRVSRSGDMLRVFTKGTAESDGCAELVWNLSEKKNSERIRRDELEAVYAGHGIAIRYASLTDPYWNAFLMSEADLDAKLSLFDGCGVTAEEKKLFKESVYEKTSDGRYSKKGSLTAEEKTAAESVLANYENYIFFHDNPYYVEKSEGIYALKDEYAGKTAGELPSELRAVIDTYCFYAYGALSGSLTYDVKAMYAVDESNHYALLVWGDREGETLIRKRFAVPDWNSARDFKTENRAAESVYWYAIEYSNKDGNGEGRAAFAINADENNFSTDEVKAGDAVLWYEKADISVLNEKYLYGGKNQWYYGIWTGDAGADFSEKKLLAARNGVFNKESFEGKRENERQKKLTPDTIEAGNTPARESEKQEGYYLPETDGNNADRLIGSVAKKYDEKKKSFIFSMPYMSGDKIHCDRAGGTGFYEIDGMAAVVENGLKAVAPPPAPATHTAYVPASVRKNESSGEDRSVGVSAAVLSGNKGWNTTRGDILQSIQDINGDGIPDIVQVHGGTMNVIAGVRTIDHTDTAEVQFVNDGASMDGVESISHNETDSKNQGGSVSASGSMIVTLARGGKTAHTNFTPSPGDKGSSPPSFDPSFGGGLSTSKGESKQTKGFVDINGDGLPDYFSGNFRLNVGDGFTAGVARQDIPGGELTHSTTHASSSNFSASLDTGISAWRQITQTKAQKLGIGANTGIGGNFSISSSKINRMLIDINGDGLPDLVTKGNGNIIGVRFNTGSTFAAEQPFSLGEWNGVGMSEDADIAVNVDYQAAEDKTGLSLKETDTDVIKDALRETIETLKSSLEYSSSINFGISGNMGMNVNVGLTFFWGTINITANVGGTIDYSSGTNGTEVRMTDLDGDGLADHVLNLPDGQIWYKRNLCGKAGLLKGIDFPYGGSCRITYGEQYGTVHMPQFKYVLESVTLSDGCGVGGKANIAHGAHEITTRYAYADGVYDRYRKEFYGYGSVRSFSGWKGDGEYESETISEYYNDAYYAKGMIKSTVVKDKAGRVYARTKNAINNRYAYYDAEASVRYEGKEYGQGIKSAYGYDAYGNVTEVRQDTYYNADIDSILAGVAQSDEREGLRAEIGYYHNDGKYFHAHPTSIAVYGSGTLLRKREGDYDSTTGALASLRQYYDSSHYAEHRFTYDAYGNTILVYEPGGSVKRYRYDDIVHQYPTTIAKTGSMERLREGRDNPRNATYESSIEWDIATGTKTSEKDINGNVMSYVYDAQQRLTEVRSPYDEGGIPAVRYRYCTPEDGFWYAVTENKVVTDANNTEVIKTFIQTDGLGRAIISAKTGCTFDVTTKTSTVGWNVGGAVSYDAKGRTIAEGQPHFIKGESIAAINLNGDITISEVYQLIRPTKKAYDALDRIVRTVLPGGTYDEYSGTGKRVQTVRYGITDEGLSYTETTDPMGNVGVQYADARGNVVKVERKGNDPKGNFGIRTSATYEYDAIGQMTSAYDAKANPITVAYDMLGRKTELTTKDGGAKRYTYDELHLLYEDDAVMRQSGSRIDYSYDGFNRVIKITYPEGGDVEYEYGAYGAANNAAGKVVSVRDEAGVTRYEYGKLGEVTKETRTLKRHIPAYESEKSAVMEYVSDYLGRMQRITYPDREVVTYAYDAGGQVCSIKGDHDGQAYTYVADIGYDEYGQRVYIKYGNGVETNYTYDENMRWLSHIDTANTYGKQYQNIEYTFDDVGNVKSYENDCMNGARYRTEQTYTYDALYQLIKAEGVTEDNPYAIPGSPDYRSNYEQNFSFDAIGNMTYKKSEETITPAIQKKGGDDLNYEFTYEYDAEYAHRLKRAGSEQKGWRYYTYDANGNVTSESDGAAPNEDTTTLTAVTVTTQTNAAGESVYEADYAWAWPWSGNTGGKKPVPNNKRRYEWNSRNLLMRSVNSVYDTRYVYSADGNRAAKWTATHSSETLYFNTMWTWHTDKGLPEGQYSKHIYLGETRVVTKQTSKLEASYKQSDEWRHRYYYHPDHLGSAQLITDYEGNEYQRIEYTPYGELWVEKKSEHEEGLRYLPYKFTAKEQDEETGLYYYGARYLDAKYSRWLSADPAVSDYIPMAPVNDEAKKHNEKLPGMGGVFNVVNFQLYHYAGNNPVKYVDPDGNSATLIGLITGGIGGAISAWIQGNEFGSKKFWAGVAGGVIAGTIAGAAVDLTVLTGGTGGIALGIIVTGGAIGGSAGSTIETLLSGEDLNVLNIIFDGIIGGLGNLAGYKAGKLLEKGVTSAIQKMIKDSTIQMKKDVIQQTSKKFGKLAWALGKNSDKIIKALIEHGGNGAITTVFDILQDIINPGKKNNEANQ